MIIALCISLSLMPAIIIAEQTAQYYYGDANCDGKVNTSDATHILKYSASMLIIDPESLNYKLADANRDGWINTADATYILKYCAGMLDIEPYLAAVTITYDAGEVPYDAEVYVPRAVEVEPGTEYTVANGATYAGHTFLCWYSDYDMHVYQPGQTLIVPNQNMKLIAIWQQGGADPTGQPTSQPTSQPTGEPTTPPDGVQITLNCYDTFNEQNVGTMTAYIPATATAVTASNIILDGYKLEDPNFSQPVTITNGVANPSVFSVNVYAYEMIDGKDFKVITTQKGFLNVNNDMNINYSMGTDIDLTSYGMFTPFGWNRQDITQQEKRFTGVFDGKGHTIRGLRIDYTLEIISSDDQYINYNYNQYVGLFAVNMGTIRNLNVYTVTWNGSESMNEYGVFGDVDVGIICGANGGMVSNCHAFGNVGTLDFLDSGAEGTPAIANAGGIVGKNAKGATVELCSYEGGVEGFYNCGGIAGINCGTIRECYFAGGINWGDDMSDDFMGQLADEYEIVVSGMGGIVGVGAMGAVSDCYVYFTKPCKALILAAGIAGSDAGSTYKNCFVQNTSMIHNVEDAGVGDIYIGYIPEQYNTQEINLSHDVSSLPSGFSTSIWDMQGKCFASTPDLINNRRGTSFYQVNG